jgi:hypothetical protein
MATAESYRENGAAALRVAVKRMRDACDEAERSIRCGSSRECATAYRDVMHSLAWGLANATSSIESAARWAHEADEMDVAAPLMPGRV